MKEVLAILRMNKVNQTKRALLDAGFPSITCRKVMGRGKKKYDFSMVEDAIIGEEIIDKSVAEQLAESHQLLPKRMFMMVVKDNQVEAVVNAIMSVNSSHSPGDGKIFVLPVSDVIRVRTMETGEAAL
jgi:nitrogen regulatory protein PII 2